MINNIDLDEQSAMDHEVSKIEQIVENAKERGRSLALLEWKNKMTRSLEARNR